VEEVVVPVERASSSALDDGEEALVVWVSEDTKTVLPKKLLDEVL
jgi:hypothetical protein